MTLLKLVLISIMTFPQSHTASRTTLKKENLKIPQKSASPISILPWILQIFFKKLWQFSIPKKPSQQQKTKSLKKSKPSTRNISGILSLEDLSHSSSSLSTRKSWMEPWIQHQPHDKLFEKKEDLVFCFVSYLVYVYIKFVSFV